jgi:CheY-like chemotaxis protein
MPDIPGTEVVNRVREFSQIPVILFTARADAREITSPAGLATPFPGLSTRTPWWPKSRPPSTDAASEGEQEPAGRGLLTPGRPPA